MRESQRRSRAVGQVPAWGAAQPYPCARLAAPRSPEAGGGRRAMAQPGNGEASMSVLERLLANAALRDEAGRLRSPEPRALPPTRVSQGA